MQDRLEVINHKELARLNMQKVLDLKKTSSERNKMGQFATPSMLAFEMADYARKLVEETSNENVKVRFLEPGFNLGAFYSALLRNFPKSYIESATGYEIDPHYGAPATDLWKGSFIKLYIEDFTKANPPERSKSNLILCNPPYVRHHHICQDEKTRLKAKVKERLGIKLSGLSGLYCYFMCLAHDFMEDDGLAGWLVPSEFMYVNYGSAIKDYLLNKVTLLHIHQFDPNEVQFTDAYVSSTIVWYRKTPPPQGNRIKFTSGGTLANPRTTEMISAKELSQAKKWGLARVNISPTDTRAKLSDLFDIKRGLATGANEFFILTHEKLALYKIPSEVLIPILPSPRYLSVDVITGDSRGNPVIDHPLFLINCNKNEKYVQENYPGLWQYLQTGIESGIDQRYLCSNRSPWYMQEKRPASPFLCTYLGRKSKTGRTFRFILNHTHATATNSYLLLYPKAYLHQSLIAYPRLKERIWELLNDISSDSLVSEGRVYGGGLHKVEPRELGNARIDINSILGFLEEAK